MSEQEEFEFRRRLEEEDAAASQAAPSESEGSAELINPLYYTGAGALFGEIAGPAINKGAEAYNASKAARLTGTNAPASVPSAGAKVTPQTMLNPKGVSVEQSLDNWRTYNEAQNEAAKTIRRDTALAKKYPNLTRAPSPAAQNLAAQKAQLAAKSPTLGSKIAAKTPGVVKDLGAAGSAVMKSGVPSWLGRGIAGGSLGFEVADAYNRAQTGDTTGAIISGLGALGSGVSLLPHPLARVIGTAVGGGAAGLNVYRDKQREKEMENVVGKAAGGAIQGYNAGKKVAEGAIDLGKKFKYNPKDVASNYPRTIPPIAAVDPKTGNPYLKKQLSSEAKAVQNARKYAQAEIDKGQYTPFFDISKRSDVDPTNYPLPIRTLDVTLPKKAETIAAHQLKAGSPEARARLNEAYESAKGHPGAHDFYAMKQLEDAFVKEFGPEAGRAAFKSRFADPLAATTGGANPNSNLMTAAYTNFMRQAGKDLPEQTYDLPFPIGGRFIAGNIDQARKYNKLGELSPVDNPKRYNFSSNFMGHRDRPTVDEQMMNLFDPKGKMAPDWYGINEDVINQLAKEKGVSPVNFQEVAWAGGKGYEGKPMMQEINEMIHRTSRITGESPDEVLKGFINSNKPMYGIGAGALGVGATSEDGNFAEGGEVQGYNAGSAVKAGLGFVKPAAKSHSQNPKVARALEAYLKGDISQAERIAIMNKQLPLRPWTEMPPAYSDEQIKMALMENKRPKALADVPAGARVGNRLDIPAYTQHGVYVDTTHDLAKGNSPISYNRTGHLKDVEFSSKPNQAVRVGLGTKEQALTPMGAEMGSAKSPFALIKGTNQGTSDEEVRRMMAELMRDPSYTQIGMDPRRHSQFYDKSTGMPVWAAEEKLQSGPLVLVPKRGLETTSWDDPRLNLSDFPGKQYAEGGSTTPAWQRKEGKNPEGGLNAAGRASYNRETGGNLKAPQPEGGPRKKSFCARMEGMKKKNTSSETANDPDSRINKSLRKWKC
jgi:hypothetical protein